MYYVSADIRYLTGSLAGLTVPSGFRCAFPTRETAERCAAKLRADFAGAAEITATGTHNRYVVASSATVERLR